MLEAYTEIFTTEREAEPTVAVITGIKLVLIFDELPSQSVCYRLQRKEFALLGKYGTV